jgi:hypothetical protein
MTAENMLLHSIRVLNKAHGEKDHQVAAIMKNKFPWLTACTFSEIMFQHVRVVPWRDILWKPF